MKITKSKLKEIIREELTKQKRGILTEGWWGWDLNEFEPWRDDTLAFIKSSEGKLKQIASIAIKGLGTLKQQPQKGETDLKGHELVRRNVHTAVVKFQKEWSAVNAKYKSGGDSWWDATTPFTSPLDHDDKLKPVDQIKYSHDYSDFLELIDALHPDFQKSRWDEGQQYSGKHMKKIRKLVEINWLKARNTAVQGMIDLAKLPKLVYKDVADGLQEWVFDAEVSDDAWNTETAAFVTAWVENDKEAESKAKQAKEHSYEYEEMIEEFRSEVLDGMGAGYRKEALDYYTGVANPNEPTGGEWVSHDDENWDYEGFITWQWKGQNAEKVDKKGYDDDGEYVQPEDSEYEIVAGSDNEVVKRSEIYKQYPWDTENAKNADIPSTPKGFLPSQRIFAKGVKQGPI